MNSPLPFSNTLLYSIVYGLEYLNNNQPFYKEFIDKISK